MRKLCAPLARACAAGLCAAVVGIADAAVIEQQYDDWFDLSTTVVNGSRSAASNTDRLSYSLSFSQFDGSLGTLTGVTISYQGQLQTSYTIARNNRGAAGVRELAVALDRTVGFELGGGSALGTDAFSTTHGLPKNQTLSAVPHPFGTLVMSGTWTAGADDLAAFIGTGSFTVDAVAALTQTLIGPNGSTLLSSAHWWGSAALLYAFTPFTEGSDPQTDPQQTPLPEPSALLLAAMGLLVLATGTHRRPA